MSLRETLLQHLGAGYFSGITLGDWLSLLRDNRFVVSPSYLPRAISITIQSILNTPIRHLEISRYRERLSQVAVEPPLFILGHYRHGTTHLHNVLSVDRRFAFPNAYQVGYPHTFLLTEGIAANIANALLPSRRPFDNVRFGVDVPLEDEMAMASAARISPYLAFVFPCRAQHYDRHLTFLDARQEEVKRWQEELDWFLKKLTVKYNKPLVLKSPPHTARIRLLLDMFPNAKFVHIHRHPCDVFRSTLKLAEIGRRWVALQHTGEIDLVERIIRQYREMYDTFFAERDRIPTGNFHEVSFEQLDRDPINELRLAYEALKLPDFNEAEAGVRRYLQSISGFKKNVYGPLSAEHDQLVRREWRRSFEEWGYQPGLADSTSHHLGGFSRCITKT